ncbi:hypothetical protein Tco_1067891 [Tanacetum coccineum]|uniref:Ty3 transposon capsid-like protein domain-containing protein n=1 Tax=Tanacetum coccineum TaxID=301880 RepID=A0ABQ5HFH8_9ASTR
MEEGRIDRMIIRRNSDELKIELERVRTQIIKLQKKKLGQKDKIAFAHYRISDLEQIIEKIQARYHSHYVLSSIDRMPPKRMSTSETLAITLAAIQQLINDGISLALKAQAASMANQTIKSLDRIEKILTISIALETKSRKGRRFYNLVMKGNDLKTYIRRFQELAVLCPNMVPNTEKLMEVFISGLPRSIEGNVTASKPQTLEEAINIAQRLMDQIIKHDSVQETNDHKRKFEDTRNTIDNNNYPKYRNNNNHSNNYNNDNYQNNHNNHNHNNDYHHNRIEDKKPSGLILPPTGILEIVLCVKGAPYIT